MRSTLRSLDECRRAGTVSRRRTFAELPPQRRGRGKADARPTFVLVVQPSIFDPSRLRQAHTFATCRGYDGDATAGINDSRTLRSRIAAIRAARRDHAADSGCTRTTSAATSPAVRTVPATDLPPDSRRAALRHSECALFLCSASMPPGRSWHVRLARCGRALPP
jgi:hypothetical protein